jgi:malate dehydrogenase
MERKDLITKNAEGMREQGQAIERFAKKTIKVCVVANPANTNCLVAMKCAPSIPSENFSCLTRLDEERVRGFVLQKARQKGFVDISAEDIEELCIWGNHSATQVPYIDSGRIRLSDGTDMAVSSLFPSQAECDELISRVQSRGAAIIQKQQASSGLSAANAIANHLIDWMGPRRPDKIFSMGILSTGNPYGVPDGLVYSFPLRRGESGRVEIVQGATISPQVRSMLDISAKELLSEKADAETLVGDLNVKGANSKL